MKRVYEFWAALSKLEIKSKYQVPMHSQKIIGRNFGMKIEEERSSYYFTSNAVNSGLFMPQGQRLKSLVVLCVIFHK